MNVLADAAAYGFNSILYMVHTGTKHLKNEESLNNITVSLNLSDQNYFNPGLWLAWQYNSKHVMFYCVNVHTLHIVL